MSTSQNLKVDWKNVPTRTITAGGVEFAYRELGSISWSPGNGLLLTSQPSNGAALAKVTPPSK